MEFFGTLSKEWALECMKDLLLVNLRGNLQIIVQVTFLLVLLWFCFVPMFSNLVVYRLPKNTVNSWVLMVA